MYSGYWLDLMKFKLATLTKVVNNSYKLLSVVRKVKSMFPNVHLRAAVVSIVGRRPGFLVEALINDNKHKMATAK